MFCGVVQICDRGSKSASGYGPGGVQIRYDTGLVISFKCASHDKVTNLFAAFE